MESEKMLVVGMLTTIIVVGLVIGASLATFDPGGTTDGNTTTSSILTLDTDLIDQSREAPDWGILMSDGEVVQLSSFEGKFVLIDLMGLNCPACETQNEEIETLIANFGDSITVISLSVDYGTSVSQIADYKVEHGVDWQHGLDTNSVFTEYFHIRYTPTLVIIDSDGFFRMYHEGVWDADVIQDTILLMDR